jgi:L-ascorbate metabolism protein UlaG (beta-lactamase superfamily)
MIDRIQWLGHGSFIIQGPPLIYINPWQVSRNVFHADVILVGHSHYDHFSLADIDKLHGPDTHIISNDAVASEIEGCSVLRPWQLMRVDRAGIKAIPAYSPNDSRHPIEAGGLGFVISLDYYDIYYAGDTQIIPEMDLIHPDIAILPIDGMGTLTVEEAAEVVKRMRPRWAIPSNWGPQTEGATPADAQAFKAAVGQAAEVVIPPLTR